MDLSALRVAFNRDLEKRHRDGKDTFGMKQNDSSEFMFLLFEFLIKWGKNQDLKRKDKVLELEKNYRENPAHLLDKHLRRRNYNFGANESISTIFIILNDFQVFHILTLNYSFYVKLFISS